MQILRRLLVSACVGVLGFSLVAVTWSHSVSTSVRNQDTVKSWLADSGFYEELSLSVVEQIAKDSEGSLAQAASNDEVQQVATTALQSTNTLQPSVEGLIDDLYVWLDGGSLPKTFSVDFGSASQQLSTEISDLAVERATELPVCTQQQSMGLGTNYDIWTASCRPAQVSAAQVGDMVQENIASSIGSAQTKVQTSEVFGDNDSPPEEIRRVYQFSRWLPFMFAGLALAATACIVIASSTRRKGAVRTGWTVIVSGVITGISAFSVSKGPGIAKSVLDNKDQATIDMSMNIVETAGQDIARTLWWYAAGLIVVGLLTVITAKIIGRTKNKPHLDSSAYPMPPTDDSPKMDSSLSGTTATSTQPTTNQKPVERKGPRPPRKIQL